MLVRGGGRVPAPLSFQQLGEMLGIKPCGTEGGAGGALAPWQVHPLQHLLGTEPCPSPRGVQIRMCGLWWCLGGFAAPAVETQGW